MNLLRLRGLVIRHYPFRESSDIVVFFSRTRGKVKLMARGRRRPTSALGAPLELFSLSEVVIYHKEGRDIHPVKEAKLLKAYGELTRDYPRYLYASAVCRFLDQSVAEGGRFEALFDLAETGISLVAKERPDALPVLFDAFLLKALAATGHGPALNACVKCRKRQELSWFSPERGGVLCVECARSEPAARPLPPGRHRVLVSLLEAPFSKVRRMRYRDDEVRRLGLEFARMHTDARDLLRGFEASIRPVS